MTSALYQTLGFALNWVTVLRGLL